MTTSIMSKISAAFKMDATVPPACVTPTIIVNDANSTPKNIGNDDDDYHTVFTKRLPSDADSQQLNSTEYYAFGEQTNETNQSLYQSCYSDDFIGGPISNECFYSDFGNQSLKNGGNNNSDDGSIDYNRSITMTPADSSCGFHNTFSVLEKHLNKSKQPKLSRQQIEYLLLKNKDSTVQNQIYIDIPINDEQCLRPVSSASNGLANGKEISFDLGSSTGGEIEMPSFFELEFEAMERLRAMWQNDNQLNLAARCDETINANVADASLVEEEFYQQDDHCGNTDTTTNANEYVYHVAKSRNGQLYIRVLRNLRLDKGKTIKFSLFLLLFFRNQKRSTDLMIYGMK